MSDIYDPGEESSAAIDDLRDRLDRLLRQRRTHFQALAPDKTPHPVLLGRPPCWADDQVRSLLRALDGLLEAEQRAYRGGVQETLATWDRLQRRGP